ncbi:TAP-like protein-domain-containing protein [Lasiosphaeria ovina]|uniref:TAP-like protein-domain-containing protein n=1 Tax=Lasiosphaeria ovina TaxID=92902 RepID=A0AAE0KA43_9PEZI|nr:TAP-like protein-domain-containing protein [Lasiosphaeria ovina]
MPAVSIRNALWPLAALLVASTRTAALEKRQEGLANFTWTSIDPSRDLQYHDCYNGYRCARLEVPLDWTNTDNTFSSGVAIGIATLPAVVPDTNPSFGGTVLVNPGGPGGSGVEMVLLFGKYLQGILDGDKHYEILGFDPRGVGSSTPSSSCYANILNRVMDVVQQGGMPPVGLGDVGLNLNYQAAAGFGQLCGQQAGQESIFAHMSTASVARDMLEIVERVDAASNRARINSSVPRGANKKPLLQYLGVSYGTILGNTFASMYPERVGRMVLDSVADADDYISGTWRKNLDDTESVIDYFYQVCFDAGDVCPLRQGQDQSAADVRGRVDAFIQTLETNPISVAQDGRVRLLTSYAVRSTIRQTVYSPVCGYEPLAIALADSVLKGNHTLILSSSGGLCTRIIPNHVPVDCPWCAEASFGILCGDSASLAAKDGRNVSWAREEVDFHQKQSSTAGEPWSRIPLSCVNWQFKPKYTFSGPFGSSVPVLLLSNRHDPATPLANAFALSRRHNGSAVVVQESYGHSALLVSTSNCTAEIVRRYFSTGQLPANGTSCAADCAVSIPFSACPGLIE